MARKMLYREVTTTTVKAAKLSLVDGEAVAETLDTEVFIGNVSPELAQRQLSKKYGTQVTIIEIVPETNKYEMPVDEFIKVATISTDDQE